MAKQMLIAALPLRRYFRHVIPGSNTVAIASTMVTKGIANTDKDWRPL
jgi:hypothetical protein